MLVISGTVPQAHVAGVRVGMFRSRFLAFVVFVSMVTALVPLSQRAAAMSTSIVISQVYGGGRNSGATFTHDYIEIFNRGSTTVSLAGLSLQYSSATGTGNFGANTGQLTEFTGGSVAPGQYFLVQEASGTTPAPPSNLTADMVDSTPINLSATAGKVALVTGTTSLGCNGGSTPCPPAALGRIVDLIGYGTANFFESAAAPAPSNTTAAVRKNEGCTETDDNSADFETGT